MQDSDTELQNWIRERIDRTWAKIDHIREKNDPTDGLMLNLYLQRIVRFEGVLNHLQYN